MARPQEALIQFLRDTEDFETLETLFMLKAHFEIIEARNYQKDTWATPTTICVYNIDGENGDIGPHEQIISEAEVTQIAAEGAGEETKYFYDFVVSPEVFELAKSHGKDGIQRLIEAIQVDEEKVRSNMSVVVKAISSGADPVYAVQAAASNMPVRNTYRV